MKFTITFKDPEGVADCLNDACAQKWETIREKLGEADFHDLIETNIGYGAFNEREVARLDELIKPWVKYSEYITVEFDTEKMTATVLKYDGARVIRDGDR